MLKSLSIEDLFNLYSYNIDFGIENSKIHFITGPNGYGKTTILNIIQALYSAKYEFLATIPFKSIKLRFSDNNIVSVIRNVQTISEDDSDEKSVENIELQISFESASDEFKANKLIPGINSFQPITFPDKINVMDLYFKSHPIYYITDGRLYSKEGVPLIMNCVARMKSLLNNNDFHTNNLNLKRLNTFEEIISRCGFANKIMQVDKRFGFRFLSSCEDRMIITPSKLSSGEQHMVIMAFELLFTAPDDSLILIDEPEISFHMLWQVDFIKNLKSILNIREMQCIVSTHSPQIFNMEWDLTTDLYEQDSNKS